MMTMSSPDGDDEPPLDEEGNPVEVWQDEQSQLGDAVARCRQPV